MKKVVLLGDSIRMIGYGIIILNYLPKEIELWQPEENCRFAKHTLRMLFDYAEQTKGADVIHWNNGLWDTSVNLFPDKVAFTSKEEYLANMLRIADILLKFGKKVIFATTTPVRETYPYNSNRVIDEYNAALVPLLKEKGIIINDLNSLLRDDLNRYICDDELHLSEEGKILCAKAVAKAIKKAL